MHYAVYFSIFSIDIFSQRAFSTNSRERRRTTLCNRTLVRYKRSTDLRQCGSKIIRSSRQAKAFLSSLHRHAKMIIHRLHRCQTFHTAQQCTRKTVQAISHFVKTQILLCQTLKRYLSNKRSMSSRPDLDRIQKPKIHKPSNSPVDVPKILLTLWPGVARL